MKSEVSKYNLVIGYTAKNVRWEYIFEIFVLKTSGFSGNFNTVIRDYELSFISANTVRTISTLLQHKQTGRENPHLACFHVHILRAVGQRPLLESGKVFFFEG